ncbi:MAG: UDP-N-acetylmuramoyl-tripeptide--D-alanyl-D-alanine ligase [Candidatus Babeliales bacterium]
MQFNEEFVKKAVTGASLLYKAFPEDHSFSIDTRTLKKGDIFVALQGKQADGHNFLAEALKKEAHGLIIAEQKKDCLKNLDKEILKKKLIILVPDTMRALVDLATAWRAQFDYPVVGITGSVGKTSTKETMSNILDLHGEPYIASLGNQNTIYGLALNILRMRAHHKIAIFEMGISRRGEMAKLTTMTKPTTAIVTNVGHCHMEGLGSIIDIASEKREIFKYFKEDSIGIINGDQPLLAQVAYTHPVIKFGSKTTNQIQARKINITSTHTTFVLKLYKEKYYITLNKNHNGLVFNSLAATAIGYLLKIPAQTILDGIQKPVVIAGRFEEKPLKTGKGIIINDCYNANPESMKAALVALQAIDTNAQKVAVLGDMLELGVNSPFWHRQLGRFLRKVPSLRKVILVGSMVKWTQKTIPVNVQIDMVASWQEALEKLKGKLDQESIVLVKGSLGIGLKNLVDELV